MLFPPWRRPKSRIRPADPRARSRRHRRTFGLSPVEPLESRRLLTFSSTLSGSTATLTVESATDNVTITESGGLLEHGDLTAPDGQSFASDFDFDSTMPGVQTLAASASSQVDIGGAAGDRYIATLGTPDSPASTLLAQFTLSDPGGVNPAVTIDDSGDTTENAFTATSASIVGTGIDVNLPQSIAVDFTTGSGKPLVKVQSTGAGESLLLGASTPNVVNIGDGTIDPTTAIQGSIADESPASILNVLALSTSSTSGDLGTSDLTGFSAEDKPIQFDSIEAMKVVLGNGTNSLDVSDTPPAAMTLVTGTGTNDVLVQATSKLTPELTIDTPSGGVNTFDMGVPGDLSNIRSPINITESGATNTIELTRDLDTPASATISRSTDDTPDNPLLVLSNFAPAPITFADTRTTTLEVDTVYGADTLTVDFSQPNSLPGVLDFATGQEPTTLVLGPSNLNLIRTSFTNEVYTATGPDAGTIAADSSTINLSTTTTALPASQIIDATTAASYTFADESTGHRLGIAAGPTEDDAPTVLISSLDSPQSFEQVAYANKGTVTIDAGPADSVVDVTGSALASGSTTVVSASSVTCTLNYDAGGQTVQVVADPKIPGAGDIISPEYGKVVFENFSGLSIVDGQAKGAPIAPPTFGATPTVSGLYTTPLINVAVATFTSAIPNAPASSFAATIVWPDGTTSAGTVVADAGSPTVYHVEGTHTFTSEREDSLVAVSVVQTASTTALIGGVAVSGTSTVVASTTTPIDITAPTSPAIESPDFDGDGKADPVVYGLIPGTKLYGFTILTSSSNFTKTVVWDNQGDGFGDASSIPVPADYFGDGKAAYAIWTPEGNGLMLFQAISSVDPTKTISMTFGLSTDVPVIADVDGDGKADFGAFGDFPGMGYRYDFLLSSRDFDANQRLIFNNYGYGYGIPGSTPVAADFDGSGHAGLGVYFPASGAGSTGTFYYTNFAIPATPGFIINPPATAYFSRSYGSSGDAVMAVDYDGDGKADLAFYGLDPRTGRYRYDILTSSSDLDKDVYFDNAGLGYGYSATIPVMADFEGNGHDDFAVYQPDGNGGASYIIQDVEAGHGVVYDFATADDIPADAPAFLIAKKVRGQ